MQIDLTLVLGTFFVFIASFVRSVTGFGYMLVATPLLMLVMAPKTVVVLNNFLGIITNLTVLWYMRRHIDFRKFVFLSLGSILGIPPGAYLLSILDPTVIKLAVAIVVIPFAVLLLSGHSRRFQRETPGCIAAGFAGGVLTTSVSIGGPPVVLFLLNQGLVKERFVGVIAAVGFLMNVAGAVTFSSMGLVTTDILWNVVLFLPFLWLGIYLGTKVLPRIPPALFRRIALTLLSLTALVNIVTVITELIS
ncbi:sulfite exporter TauE/SafE family protein [Chloroflexota bacterium]